MNTFFKKFFFIFILFLLFTISNKVFAATFVSDTFTGTGGTALESHTGETGATWAQNSAVPSSSIVLTNGGRVRSGSSVNSANVYVASGIPGSADYDVEADMYVGTAAGCASIGARFSTTNLTGYLAGTTPSGNLQIYKYSNGSLSGLLSEVSYSFSAGQTYDMKFTVRTVSGNAVLTLYVNDNQVATYTDSSSPITSAGRAAFFFNSLGATPSDTVGYHFDNLVASSSETNAITLTSPKAYQTIQRDSSNQADITISGTYTGSPTAIEASWNGGSYSTIVASPSGGTFSGTLSDQTGGQGTLTVRFANATTVNASANYVGVGDIFVVAGQSNAEGWGYSNQAYSSSTLKATLFGNDYNWKDLIDPIDSNSGQVDSISSDGDAAGSVWPLIATYIMEDQSVPVSFITSARSGSGLATTGQSGQPQWYIPTNHQDRTTLYGSMAYRALQVGQIKGVLWWQGESDAVRPISYAVYASALDDLANAINTDLGAVKLIPTVLQNSSGISDALELEINNAIKHGWASNSNIVAGPILSDMGSDDAYHLRTNENLAIAAGRWWNALLLGLYSVNPYSVSGPASGRVGESSTNFTVSLASGGEFNGGYSITLSDGGAGGTFTPSVGSSGVSSVTVTPPSSATSFTFTYTPASTGSKTLTFTNSQGWSNQSSLTYTSLALDSTPPSLSFTSVSVNEHIATITFTTDEAGTISYSGSCSASDTSASVGENIIALNTLADGTYSDCSLIVTDSASNPSESMAINSFTIDTTDPVISNITVTSSSDSITATWNTNEATSSQVYYGLTASYGSNTSETNTSPRVLSHSVTINGLSRCTDYNLKVFSEDSLDNNSESSNQTIKTTGCSSTSSGSYIINRYNYNQKINNNTINNNSDLTNKNKFYKNLKYPNRDSEIKRLQKFLNMKGFFVSTVGAGSPGKETNYFGILTKNALIRFQKANGIRPTGFFGPITRAYINSLN